MAKYVTKKDVLIWTVIMNRKDYATDLLREGRNSICNDSLKFIIIRGLNKIDL